VIGRKLLRAAAVTDYDGQGCRLDNVGPGVR